MFSENIAKELGGAIVALDETRGTVTNSTFVGNQAKIGATLYI